MKVKKIFIIIISLLFITSFANYTYASTPDYTITDTGREWLDTGKDSDSKIVDTDITTSAFQELAGLLMGAGIFVAIGVGIILGMKYMFSTAEGKAEVSKTLFPYLVGIVVITGALTIWQILIRVLDV